MRIGLLTSVPKTVDAFFRPWVDRWRAQGHGVSVAAALVDAQFRSEYVDTGLPGLGQAPGPGAVVAARALRQWVRDARLDVVLTNTATASALVRGVNVACPVVYFCHGLHWSDPPVPVSGRLARLVEGALIPRTAGVITMNSHDRAWFDRRSETLPHMHLSAGIGLDLVEWPWVRRAPVRKGGVLRLVWVGDFSARKRPEDALHLMRLLHDRAIRATLTMVGDGPLMTATRDASGPSLAVTFAGRVPSARHLAAADALIHTAAWEGLSRVLLEASSTGLPSFGYSVKGVRDCPGARSKGASGDVEALASMVVQWMGEGQVPPQLDRSMLDWRLAHDQVTEFLEPLAREASRP